MSKHICTTKCKAIIPDKPHIIFHDVKQGTEEWHNMREGLYTGTNFYRLLKHGHSSRFLNKENNFFGNFATERGHILEKEAIELYEKIENVSILRPGFVTNSRYPMCGVSLDGFRSDFTATVENKSFFQGKHMSTYRYIPADIESQLYFEGIILETDYVHLILYNPEYEDPKLSYKIEKIKMKQNIVRNCKKRLKELENERQQKNGQREHE